MEGHGPYSHSRIACFRQCPRKFQLRYVEGIPARRRGIEAFLGNRVHEALEFLYRELGAGRAVERGALLERYRARWDREFGDDVHVVKEDVPPEHYRAVGETCLADYYRAHAPFPDAARTLGLERRVAFNLGGDERYPIRGYVDRLVRGADDVLEIHDYKTGSRRPRRADLEGDGQLALYQIGLGRVFPEQRGVRLVWHFLVPGERIELEKTAAELEAVGRRTRAAIDRIRAARTFEPRASALCRWCDYHDLCPVGWSRIERARSPAGREAVFVGRYAGIKRAAGTPGSDPKALRREAALLRAGIRDYVSRTGRTVLEGRPGRLIVTPPGRGNGGKWVMRLES